MIAEGQVWKLGALDFWRIQRIVSGKDRVEVFAAPIGGSGEAREKSFTAEAIRTGKLIGGPPQEAGHYADGRSEKAGQ